MKRSGLVVLAAVSIGLAGCGGSAPSASDATAGAEPAAPATTEALDTPEALGDAIGASYVGAYADVVTVLASRPAPDVAAAWLADLKELYVQRLVALGHLREALDDVGRAEVDTRIVLALGDLPAETLAAYQVMAADYALHTGVADLIGDFNIIGQYANFDLLREQEPEEAARLGIG